MKIQDLRVKRPGPFGIEFQGEISILPGTILGLYGPNGSGKTSLMKALAGVLPAEERGGFVFIGTDMTDLGHVGGDWVRQVLYLGSDFQTPFPIRVRDLFEMAAAVSKGGIHLELGSAERTRIAMVIEAMGLFDELNRNLHTLSDGQKQWIMFARGLIQRPRLLLLDETFSKLDLDRLHAITRLLRSNLTESMSLWVASHDLRLLHHISDSVLLLPQSGQIQMMSKQNKSLEEMTQFVYPGLKADFS